MYVCVCSAVTEKHIHHAVKNGAKTVKHLKEQLNVGAECGRCVSCAKVCIKEAHAEHHHEISAKRLVHITPLQLGAA